MKRFLSGLLLPTLLALLGVLLLPAIASAAITEYSVPTAVSLPDEITSGPGGALWFSEYNASRIGRVTTSGAFTEYLTPTPSSGPATLTTGPDGALWFVEHDANKIGRLNPALASPGTSNGITEYQVPTPGGVNGGGGIVTGPDGALWFIEPQPSKIGRLDPALASPGTSNGITEYPIPTAASLPVEIVVGPDGKLWFGESSGNNIGRIDPALASPGTSNGITEYLVPTPSSRPCCLTQGPDGALWFTEFSGNKVGRLDLSLASPGTSNGITEDQVPTANSQPGGITAGPDGALWFTEFNASQIGRVTRTGSFNEYATPTANSLPNMIVAGPDQALWFTEENANKIGKLTSHLVPAVANTLTVKLVNNFRQTLTPTACTASGRTAGSHRAPFSMPSCLPPAFLPGTAAALGPGSDSSVLLTALQDNTSTAPDEGDIGVEAHLKNVICLSAVPGCAGYGAPYDPITGPGSPDVTLKFKLRLSDDLNCSPGGCGGPFTSPGTVVDFDFKAAVDCTTAAPAASCDLVTSIDAVTGTPTAVAGGANLNAQVFRVRVADAGTDSILGNANDKEFAMQGLAVH